MEGPRSARYDLDLYTATDPLPIAVRLIAV
jgi:hypothetical protein